MSTRQSDSLVVARRSWMQVVIPLDIDPGLTGQGASKACAGKRSSNGSSLALNAAYQLRMKTREKGTPTSGVLKEGRTEPSIRQTSALLLRGWGG